jgi:hypothetical protein
MPPPKKSDLKARCARAREIYLKKETLSAEWKKVGEEYDEAVRDLRGVPGTEAHGVRLSHTFAKKNTEWGHGSVREYEIELVDMPAAAAPATTPAKSSRQR